MNISTLLRRLPAVVSLLLFVTTLNAQAPQIYLVTTPTDVDSEVAIEVRGVHFDSLVGIQFSLAWDTELFNFLRVDNITLNGSQAGNFNQAQLSEGRIGYLESDGSLQGFGLPDSSLLFMLYLDPITTVSTTTEITLGEHPLPPRSNSGAGGGISLDPEFVQATGTLTLNGSNSLVTFADDPRLRVAPNPFRDHSQLSIALRYAGKATVDLLDLSGRVLDRRPVTLTAPTTILDLTADRFPANGAYVIRLTTGREQLHRKVIVHGR